MRESSAAGLTTALGRESQEDQQNAPSEEDGETGGVESSLDAETSSTTSARSYDPIQSDIADEHVDPDPDEDIHDNRDPRTKVLSVPELEDLFIASAPDLSGAFLLSVVCMVLPK